MCNKITRLEYEHKTGHSLIGGSSCERFWNCPGSANLIAQLGIKSKVEQYTVEGTVAHQLCELALNNKSMDIVNKKLHDIITIGEFEVEITDKMVEGIQLYFDTVMAEYNKNPNTTLYVEKSFSLPDLNISAYGTVDAIVFVPFGKLTIFDYKNGTGRSVVAQANKQLLYYAYLVYNTFKHLIPDTIELVIVQPNNLKEDYITRTTITIDELIKFGAELKKRIDLTTKPDAPLIAGSWCSKTFCPARAKCPALYKHNEKTAMIKFNENKLPPNPNVLTIEQMEFILDRKDILLDWLKKVEAELRNHIEIAGETEKYKLVEKRTNRKWDNEKEVIERYEAEFGETLYNKKLKSPAQLEKLLGKKRKDELNNLVIKPKGALVLAPKTSKRISKSETVFEVIEGE